MRITEFQDGEDILDGYKSCYGTIFMDIQMRFMDGMPYVKTMYYLDVDFYRYYIGREDQSVNESVMISRIDQQLKVNYYMIDDYLLSKEIENEKLRHYMRNYLEIIMVVSSIMLIRSKSVESLQKKYALWNYLKENDRRTYYWMKWSVLGRSMNLPGKSGRKISEMAYELAQKFVGFNYNLNGKL